MPAQVISMGYEQRSVSEFIGLLVAHGVHKLVDVREVPISRRKGFSKTALADHLAAAHIKQWVQI
ncbi:MAG: DUF488 family protein [Anaerolineae bacterium]